VLVKDSGLSNFSAATNFSAWQMGGAGGDGSAAKPSDDARRRVIRRVFIVAGFLAKYQR
jgi:hypothetical protein